MHSECQPAKTNLNGLKTEGGILTPLKKGGGPTPKIGHLTYTMWGVKYP